MKKNTRWGRRTPNRTLLAVAVSAALFGSAEAASDGAGPNKSKAAATSGEHNFERPVYSDEQWRAMARSSLAVRVQSNLAGSASLRGADITVSSDGDGEVTLKGTVATERQQERAVKIAERTAGVRSVDDEIDVNDSFAISAFEGIDDEKLAEKVAQTIARQFDGAKVKESWFFGYKVEGRSDTGNDWAVDVDADEGVITLDGELPRNEDVAKALQATRRLASVRRIENDISSNESRAMSYAPLRYHYYSPGQMYSGTLVTAKGAVQGELVCQLADSGGHAGASMVTKAKHTQGSTPGKPAARNPDRPTFSDTEWQSVFRSSLATRVQSALVNSAALRGTDISVTSNTDGEVTVSGKVSGERQKERAIRIAQRTPGVKNVNSELQIDDGLEAARYEPVDDDKLAKLVAQAIADEFDGAKLEESWFFGYRVEGRSQSGNDWKIEVDADDGVITLNGDVPRNEDVQTALQVTRRVAAVRSIDNDIDSDEERYLTFAPERYRYRAPGYMHPAPMVTAMGPVNGDLICQVASVDAGNSNSVVKAKMQSN